MIVRLFVCTALIVFIIRSMAGYSMESSIIRSAVVFLILFIGYKLGSTVNGIINNRQPDEKVDYKENVNQKQAG